MNTYKIIALLVLILFQSINSGKPEGNPLWNCDVLTKVLNDAARSAALDKELAHCPVNQSSAHCSMQHDERIGIVYYGLGLFCFVVPAIFTGARTKTWEIDLDVQLSCRTRRGR